MIELTLADAAREYGYSPNSLRQACAFGRLKARKVRGVWLVREKAVREYITGRVSPARGRPRKGYRREAGENDGKA